MEDVRRTGGLRAGAAAAKGPEEGPEGAAAAAPQEAPDMTGSSAAASAVVIEGTVDVVGPSGPVVTAPKAPEPILGQKFWGPMLFAGDS